MSRLCYGLPPGRLVAIVLGAAVVPAVLLAAPAIAAQLAVQLGLGPAQIGTMFSTELAAMSLATLPAWWWQGRLDCRIVGLAGAMIFIAANIASMFATTYEALLALRFLSALGGGTVMVICMASAGASPERERVYGLWVCGQLVLGALALWLLPGLFARFGLAALYAGLAALMALCLPFIAQFSAGSPHRDTSRVVRRSHTGRAALAIGAVLAFYVGLSGVWAFIGTIAGTAGLDGGTSGEILAIASLLGIAGSLTATLLGSRVSRSLPILGGYLAMIAAVGLLLGVPGLVRFTLAAFLFKFVWTFVLPFILATVADLDTDGRLMSTTNLVIGGGLAIGPAIAGQILERAGGTGTMLVTSGIILGASLTLLCLSRIPSAPLTEPAR